MKFGDLPSFVRLGAKVANHGHAGGGGWRTTATAARRASDATRHSIIDA